MCLLLIREISVDKTRLNQPICISPIFGQKNERGKHTFFDSRRVNNLLTDNPAQAVGSLPSSTLSLYIQVEFSLDIATILFFTYTRSFIHIVILLSRCSRFSSFAKWICISATFMPPEENESVTAGQTILL